MNTLLSSDNIPVAQVVHCQTDYDCRLNLSNTTCDPMGLCDSNDPTKTNNTKNKYPLGIDSPAQGEVSVNSKSKTTFRTCSVFLQGSKDFDNCKLVCSKPCETWVATKACTVKQFCSVCSTGYCLCANDST